MENKIKIITLAVSIESSEEIANITARTIEKNSRKHYSAINMYTRTIQKGKSYVNPSGFTFNLNNN